MVCEMLCVCVCVCVCEIFFLIRPDLRNVLSVANELYVSSPTNQSTTTLLVFLTYYCCCSLAVINNLGVASRLGERSDDRSRATSVEGTLDFSSKDR